MDNLRGGHCWCRWHADGAVRRGDFGQIGYRDYTPGGCHARSSPCSFSPCSFVAGFWCWSRTSRAGYSGSSSSWRRALSAWRCCCSTVALSPNTPRPITLSRWCALGLVVSCRAGV